MTELELETLCQGITATSLTLPPDLPREKWLEIGELLARSESTLHWHTVDWWAFGTHQYGERYQAAELLPLAAHTYENLASVARAFQETSRRRESLSFSHHAEVARLPPEEADRLLDWCEQGIAANGRPRSRRELRATRDEVRREEVHRQVDKLNIAKEDASRRFSASIASAMVARL